MTGWVWDRFESIADEGGDKIALVHGGESLTFRQLKQAALAWAASLRIEPGARVLICGENSASLAALVPAVWRWGGIPVMLYADAPRRHLDHAVSVSAPAYVFADDPDAVTDFPQRRRLDVPASSSEPLDSPAQRTSADPASIIFTSGSTGLPKGVTQSSFNLIDGASRVARMLGYRRDDRIVCPVPFAFDYGWGQLLSLLLEGITLVLPRPRNAFGLCEALKDHAPSVFAGVPAVFADLQSGLAPIQTTPRDSVRLITNTGSKIPSNVFDGLRELFPSAQLSLNYGLTETYRSASLPMDLAHVHPNSVGFAVPGAELEVRKEDGSLAGPGEEGEIIHRGAGAFIGYWNDPERTQAVLRPDPANPEGLPVVYTGDLGRIDSNGMLYIHGRRDRQIKSMGVRVSPDEIEALLQASGLVSAAAVTSLPHDILGEMVVACVIPPISAEAFDAAQEKPMLRSLRIYAREQMSPYMQPRLYQVMAEFPRTRSGKVDYPALKALLQSDAA